MDLLNVDFYHQLLKDHLGMILLLATSALFYFYYSATFNYFKERGVVYKKPWIVFGSTASKTLMTRPLHEIDLENYKYFDGLPYGGYFDGRQPLLLLRDPDLIKAVLIKDFDHFLDRNSKNITSGPMQKMLQNLKGKEWKSVRSILTPTFSSGKLRGMENLIQECGKIMVEMLKNRPSEDTDVEMKSFLNRYTLEVIGSCAFGLDCASLKNPDTEFMKDATSFSKISSFKKALLLIVMVFCPYMMKYLPFSPVNMEAYSRLSAILTHTRKQRKDKNQYRNDFLQLLINAAQKEQEENPNSKVMTETIMQAQAILFLLAGQDTSSTLMSFVCYVLCRHQDIQDRLRKEIIEVTKDRECTYDMLKELPYLEKVMCETLRLYTPVSKVDRECTKAYTLPGTNIQINKGDMVGIPIIGLHMDPQYYPNPEVFDPERFSSEEKAKRPQHLYLPFGGGPRICIGLRFAQMSAKFGLVYLLKNFKLSPCSKTEYPMKYRSGSIILGAKNGIWVKVEPVT